MGWLIPLEAFQAARRRLQPYVRHTPVLEARTLKAAVPAGRLLLKLESLQVSGSFKVRGALNKLLSLPEGQAARGLVTASGGNHGLGVAFAGWLRGVPATVYLPANTPPAKARKVEAWGARVVAFGQVWDDANREALAVAQREGLTYVHAFADPEVIAGQGTLALELLQDASEVEVLLVPVGGGGLISGVAAAARAVRPEVQVIGVEPEGAPTLYESLRQGRLVELPEVRTAANTLAPRRSEPLNFEIIRQTVERIVLVSDEELGQAARWLWFELGVAAELSAAAGVAALLSGRVGLDGRVACAIVSGAGTAGIG